jgi:hypothetical protein
VLVRRIPAHVRAFRRGARARHRRLPDGPASFNAEATARGARVVSCDPIYRWETAQVADRITATYDQVLEETRRNAADFVWTSIRSVEELGRIRMDAMRVFLDVYDAGKRDGSSRPPCRSRLDSRNSVN